MPKKNKKMKNAKNVITYTRELILKEVGQEYARVTKLLGSNHVQCDCYDNKERLGAIRRRVRRGKTNRMVIGSIVLLSLRDFQDDKADIVHVYDDDEVSRLKKMYELPDDTGTKADTVLDDIFKMDEDMEEEEHEINLDDI